jgi:hypothetical protein
MRDGGRFRRRRDIVVAAFGEGRPLRSERLKRTYQLQVLSISYGRTHLPARRRRAIGRSV